MGKVIDLEEYKKRKVRDMMRYCPDCNCVMTVTGIREAVFSRCPRCKTSLNQFKPE